LMVDADAVAATALQDLWRTPDDPELFRRARKAVFAAVLQWNRCVVKTAVLLWNRCVDKTAVLRREQLMYLQAGLLPPSKVGINITEFPVVPGVAGPVVVEWKPRQIVVRVEDSVLASDGSWTPNEAKLWAAVKPYSTRPWGRKDDKDLAHFPGLLAAHSVHDVPALLPVVQYAATSRYNRHLLTTCMFVYFQEAPLVPLKVVWLAIACGAVKPQAILRMTRREQYRMFDTCLPVALLAGADSTRPTTTVAGHSHSVSFSLSCWDAVFVWPSKDGGGHASACRAAWLWAVA
jgi:hypothetical protein